MRHLLSAVSAAVAATALTAASACYAQSSVTLYGTVDDGLTFTNNQGGHHAYQMSNGGKGSSKWGFKISEDLGNGLRANADLENGFDVNSGKFNNNGREFGRQAYVGLSGGFGSVRLGRQYDLVMDALQPISASLKFGGGLATHVADVDNVWGDYAVSNVVKYTTPNVGGFTASGLLSLGGVAGNFQQNRGLGADIIYSNGTLLASAVLSRLNNPATTLYDATANPVAGTTFVNSIVNPSFSGYVSANTMQTAGAAVNYLIGRASLGLLYTNTRFEDVVRTSSTPFSGTAVFSSIEANGTYRLSTPLMLGASYNYTKAEQAKYSQVNLGAEYDVSKRTYFYLIGAWEHAIGTNSINQPAVAALSGLTPSTTPNQVAIRLGVRHNF